MAPAHLRAGAAAGLDHLTPQRGANRQTQMAGIGPGTSYTLVEEPTPPHPPKTEETSGPPQSSGPGLGPTPSLGHSQAQWPCLAGQLPALWAGLGHRLWHGPESQRLSSSPSPTSQLSKKTLSDRGSVQGLIKWALTTRHPGSRPFPPFNPARQEPQFPHRKNGLMTSFDLEPQTKLRGAWGQ